MFFGERQHFFPCAAGKVQTAIYTRYGGEAAFFVADDIHFVFCDVVRNGQETVGIRVVCRQYPLKPRGQAFVVPVNQHRILTIPAAITAGFEIP